ncbi:MAG: DUF3131 domain-containing protein, partial [Acidobacteriota bacterium]
MSDAIARTFYRMIQKRRMLEWTTAAQAEKFRGSKFVDYVLRLRGELILSLVTIAIILAVQPSSLSIALPFVLLWANSPVLTFVTGKPIPRRERIIPQFMIPVLRGYAREIWRYFETLVGEETHWLPPDNFQETPDPLVAPRTSPTNIGFLLLSNIAAYDLGYIGAVEFVERTEKTLNTLSHLKTFNGHLFNWYSTTSLEPLEPRYISTVDSGNLVAALMVVRQFALRFGLNLARSIEHRAQRHEGVRDTLHQFLLRAESSSEFGKNNREILAKIKGLTAIESHDARSNQQLLEELQESLAAIQISGAERNDLGWWLDASRRVVATHIADFERPQDIASRMVTISREAEALYQEVDFQFLFHKKRGIFSIGFNVTNGQLDRSFYDLFASEARLASFVAIANGDVPQSHWFRMSRAMTSFGRRRVLLSWSGSMFEYLM